MGKMTDALRRARELKRAEDGAGAAEADKDFAITPIAPAAEPVFEEAPKEPKAAPVRPPAPAKPKTPARQHHSVIGKKPPENTQAKAAQWVVEVEGAPKPTPTVEEDPWAAQAASVLPPAEPKDAPLVGARKPEGVLPAVEPTPDEARRSYLSVHYSKDNRTAEEFRALKNALLAHGQNPRVIAVASCGAGEGKTALAVNLATSFADTYGEKVVLVDGNIRRPKLAEVLGLSGEGLSDVVRGHVKADDMVAKTHIPGLWALGAGKAAERSEGLLDSRSVGELLKWLRKRYSRVIVELPALCDAPEALALARQADVVLVSVLKKRTRRAGLMRMLESFKGLDREKVRCVFVNA